MKLTLCQEYILLVSTVEIQLIGLSDLFFVDLPLELAAGLSDIVSQSRTVRWAPDAGQVITQCLEAGGNTRQTFCRVMCLRRGLQA